MAFNTDVINVTLEDTNKEVVDGLYESTPFLGWARKLGKIEHYNSGTYRRRLWQIADFSNDTVIDDNYGFKEISLNMNSITSKVDFEHMRAIWPVALGGKEDDENTGEEAIVKLADIRLRSSMAAMMRKVDRQIVAGDQADYAQLGSINGHAAHGITKGFLEGLAAQVNILGDGTNTFNKGTHYANGVLGARHQFATGGGSLAIADLDEIYTEASTLVPDTGDGKVIHLSLATVKAITVYRNKLFTGERFMNGAGFENHQSKPDTLMWNGAPLVPHRHMPGQGGATVYSWVGLNLDAIQLNIHSNADFKFGGFQQVQNGKIDGAVGHIKFMGALTVGDSLASSFVYLNADAP
jgi:hypothetical protein